MQDFCKNLHIFINIKKCKSYVCSMKYNDLEESDDMIYLNEFLNLKDTI